LEAKLISFRTTDFRGADSIGRAFESNMFSQTNEFALADENGRINVETAVLVPGGAKVSRVRSTGHLVDLNEETSATLLFPLTGELRVRVSAAEYRITPNAVCVFGPNARRTRTEPSRSGEMFHALALMIPNRALRDLVQAGRDREALFHGMPDGLPLPARLPEARRLADLLGFIARQFDEARPLSAQAGAAMAVLIEELLADLVRRATLGPDEDRVFSASYQRVRKAEEIMRARSDEPLSMAELACEVGVGLRSLQLAFIEARAMEPRDVLLRLRLERARERLLKPGPTDTVTSIALDCGFAHLGRFPAAYRIAFGELPAETLARARRKAS
jgi:AraC-like DNA-binding protein